jgi:hypothetical protein
MISQEQRRASGPVKGCILPLLGFVGFIALCYVFCYVIFLIASPDSPLNQPTTTGALWLRMG